MVFNSYIFLFIFLPIVLLGWFGLHKWKKTSCAKVFLVIMNLWFYAYFNWTYVFIILGSMLMNYLCSYGIQKKQRFWGGIAVFLNLAVLFYFKYMDFFISNVNTVFKTSWTLHNIVLPLGISFYTFQQISFILDRMHGEAEHYAALDYMIFVTFFPQLIAGPIVSHDEMLPQFQDESRYKFQADNFARGLYLFILGLGKKAILADFLAMPTGLGYDNIAALDSVSAVIVSICYMLQIYFDFSGYCDMAVGLGRMMNIDLPINFNSPYKSCSIKEFWTRWHITLNRFFTKYVYIPLGGSRSGKAKTVRNVMIVFLLSGIWHGADWSFVLFGLSHGIILSLERLQLFDKFPKWMRRIGTLIVVDFAWIFFRSDTLQTAFMFFKKLFTGGWNGSLLMVGDSMQGSGTYVYASILKALISKDAAEYIYLSALIILLIVSIYFCIRDNAVQRTEKARYTVGSCIVLSLIFVYSILCFSNLTTFLYFNF